MTERRGTNPLGSLVKTTTVDLSNEELDFILDKVVIKDENNVSRFHEESDETELLSSLNSKKPRSRSLLSIVSSVLNRVDRAILTEDALKSKRSQVVSLYNTAYKFVNEIIEESIATVEKKRFQKEKGKVSDYILTTKTEKENSSLFDLADEFVKETLQEATRRVDNFNLIGISRFRYYTTPDKFTVKDGMDIVAKFVSEWSFNPNWFYKTVYNGRMISDTSHTYYYIVRWSVPTPSYPVAQVTVDVNFVIDVIATFPPPMFIEVWYRIETYRSQHSAFTTKFLERWIQGVVRHKLKSFQLFQF